MPEHNLSDQQLVAAERVAAVAHEVNRAYCKSIGDDSQPSWYDAPAWQKESAIQGVIFHVSNPGVTPQESHANWIKQKDADGWTYGDVKDPAKKQHPCFVPYDQLPQAQKSKDYIFGAIVKALAEYMG